MTYNKFLLVFKEKEYKNENYWLSVGFLLSEIVSGTFYSLHFFSQQSIKMVKWFWGYNKNQNNFLKKLTTYANLFFDPNQIQSQLIRLLVDKAGKINKFDALLRTITSNYITRETVKLHKSVSRWTKVLAVLTVILAILAIPNFIDFLMKINYLVILKTAINSVIIFMKNFY